LKLLARSVFFLAIIEMLVLVAGFIIVTNFDTPRIFNDIGVASAVFTLITLLVLIIFFRGQSKEPASQIMHSLVAVSIKFLAELIFAFIWFFIAKKTGLSSVVLFFVLYLTFTLYSVLIILKTVKGKSLE
jgi:drug/metabolite transporter (DMT)-like permease